MVAESEDVAGVENKVVLSEIAEVASNEGEIVKVVTARNSVGVRDVDREEFMLFVAVLVPLVAEGTGEADAFDMEGGVAVRHAVRHQEGAVEVVGAEVEEGVWLVALPGDIMGKGEQKFGEIESDAAAEFE